MNRVIKFRAWDPIQKEMLLQDKCYPASMITQHGVFHQNPKHIDDNYFRINRRFEIMQFTGLTDKNGKEIYESDIVRSSWYEGVVDWFWHGWHVRTAEGGHHTFRTATYTIEIIGNIYENPELIKP